VPPKPVPRRTRRDKALRRRAAVLTYSYFLRAIACQITRVETTKLAKHPSAAEQTLKHDGRA
jgi:hypothetical protein